MFLSPVSLPSKAAYLVSSSFPDTASVTKKTTVTRLRHSSTPNSLPSTQTTDICINQPFCNEAEDIYVRRLAGWEERVLRARDERKTRRLQRIYLAKAKSKIYFKENDGCERVCQDRCSRTRSYPGLDESSSRKFLCSSSTHSLSHPIEHRSSLKANFNMNDRKECSFNRFTWQDFPNYCASDQSRSCSCSQYSTNPCHHCSLFPLPAPAILNKSDKNKTDLFNVVRLNTSISLFRNQPVEIVSENENNLAPLEAGSILQGFCSRISIDKLNIASQCRKQARLRRYSLQESLLNSFASPVYDQQPESYECISLMPSSCYDNKSEKMLWHIDNKPKSKLSVIHNFERKEEIGIFREKQQELCDTSQVQCSIYKSDLIKSSTNDSDTSNPTFRISTNNHFSALPPPPKYESSQFFIQKANTVHVKEKQSSKSSALQLQLGRFNFSGSFGIAQVALILLCFVNLTSAGLVQQSESSVIPRELVEITDYLLLFRASQIGSLSAILPKLAVIRGHRLVHNSALAVYQMRNLKTLGLYSLTSIMRGGVRIEKNPSLCYVNTINWKNIVVDNVVIIEENMDSNACLETCPNNCETNCWDPDYCQIRLDKCAGDSSLVPIQNSNTGSASICYSDSYGNILHSCSGQCLGGCHKQMSPEHCFACRNVWYTSKNMSVCVDKCPPNFLSYKNWKCISEEACMKLRYPEYDREEDEFYKIHTVDQKTKECVHQCPANFEAVEMTTREGQKGWLCQACENCPRWCEGGVINSREEAQRYKDCTHIHGDVEIRVSESDISPVLEENLKDIKIIEGSFKVTRSFALVSLFFFKQLEEIQNLDNKEFSITVMENDNLQKLFPRKVKVSSGKAFVHYNQKLCMEEIKNFIENGNMAKPDTYEVSDVTNGNKAACSKEKLNFNINFKFSRFVGFNMSDYRHNLAKTRKEDLNALIGYEIFYREITEEQFKEKSVSKYEGLDACGSNVWNVIDMRPSPRNSTQASSGGNAIEDWYKDPEIGELKNLKPYTPYAVYANTLMVPHLATEASGAQSDVIYFRTNSEPPEEVFRLKWKAEEESSLYLSWQPPRKAHGIIDHYEVQVEMIQLDNDKMLREKNYCINNKPEKQHPIVPEKKPEKKQTPEVSRNDSSCAHCNCEASAKPDTDKIPDRGEDHIQEQEFYNDLINKIFVIPLTITNNVDHGMRRKRSINIDNIDSSNSLDDDEKVTSSEDELFVLRKIQGMMSLSTWTNETKKINDRFYQTVHLIVKDTTVLIENLKHFSLYQVKVMACQKAYISKITRKYQKDCSSWTIEEAKTLPKASADDIVMKNDEIDIYMANETTGKTFIRWIPPADPNQMIIYYTVRTTQTLSDESTNFFRCIPLSAVEIDENGWAQTKLTREGEIWVSLRAVSMYGPGKWTKWQWAMVNSDSSYAWVIILVVLSLAGVVIFVGIFMYRHWRKKGKSNGASWIIVSPNPDYLDTGFVYQQDDWEVSRELITKGEELGSGSFGVCYRGIYCHHDKGNIPVAIKSVPDHATFRQRIEFLNEASVMKDINTEYVVRLIGVVSQGQPTLVLMELMENGDLRKYLRSLRPDISSEQPTLQQTLKMALEIADGMAYLSVRKYVHRDLAARNCMVSSDFVVKVGDFGMAQDVYEKEYYRTEGRRLLPVRWMAPESLRDGKFTSKSDVWSYGVVLWEMATLAEQPYQGWCNDEVVSYVKEGSIMPRPDGCPAMLYDMMRDCWQRNPDHRPSFLDICERLLGEADDHYMSNSFYLSSQGVEAVANQRAHRTPDDSLTTPLTYNGGHHSDNNGSVTTNGDSGSHVPSTQAQQNIGERSGGPATFRSPTHVSFPGLQLSSSSSNDSPTDKTSMGLVNGIGLGVIKRFRNKSGSSSAGDTTS